MKIIDQDLFKFDYYLPINNWIYPVGDCRAQDIDQRHPQEVFQHLAESPVKSRAFYFHIPFCKSICSFCTFERAQLKKNSWLEMYTQALIREIQLKARYDAITRIPVKAIFFGGVPHQPSPRIKLKELGRQSGITTTWSSWLNFPLN